VDLTPWIQFGRTNVLAIRLDNPPNASRWYPGGGIYRNVWLVKTHPIHVAHWGTRIVTSEVSDFWAVVNVEATIDNDSSSSAAIEVSTEIFELNSEGHRPGRAVARIAPINTTVSPGSSALVKGS